MAGHELQSGGGDGLSRRDFVKTTAALSLASLALGGLARAAGEEQQVVPWKRFGNAKVTKDDTVMVRPGGSDTLKVGLVGCGVRGTPAMLQSVESSPGVQIYAVGDLFQDQLDAATRLFQEKAAPACNFKDRCFTGFDAYQKVIDSGVDLVILATPPVFRPVHLAYAVEKNKHVFMEKPVAVDPAGIRSVIESARKAKEKKLSLVAGTQRRHQKSYLETVKRIHDGAIGEIVGGSVYWMQGEIWVRPRQAEWSDMEYQLRNWPYFYWLSGDIIVEQHVHNLDVMCWVMGGPPVKAIGLGGRQVRTGPDYGNVYDHFAIEYEFANGAGIESKCCQMPGSNNRRVQEVFAGTKGFANALTGLKGLGGEKIYEFTGDEVNPYVQEHADLIASIRKGEPLNEGEQVAISTGSAILGRMAAYTGNEIKYSWMLNASKLDLLPKRLEFGPHPVNPVAGPGITKLV